MYNYFILCSCVSVQVLVIVDAKPKALGLPTDAYYAIEEVHDVSDNIMLAGD